MSFEKAIEIYLSWKTTHTNSATKNYAIRLNQLALFIGLDKQLNQISGDDIIRFHHSLRETTYQKGSNKFRYSQSTVAYSTRILKNFFMFWQGRRETIVNPKEILPIRFVSPIKKVVSESEFKTLSTSLDERFYEDLVKKVVIHLLWDTGMRISELCDLNISDINSVNAEFGVRTANVRTRKTMRYNLVVWSKDTDALLNKYLGLRLCIDAPNDALILNSRSLTSKRITTRTLQRWVKDLAVKNDLDAGLTPHSFRHGKAHHILNCKEGNVRDIHAILRHIKPESSFHYLTMNETQFIKTAAKYLIQPR